MSIVVLDDDVNLYAYVGNDPLNLTDPTGMESGAALARTGCMTAGTCPTRSSALSRDIGLIADFTPVVGDVKGIVEAVQDPSAVNIVAAGVGLVPGVGDAAAKVIKGTDKIADAARGTNFFRGARTGETPSFTPRPNEFKVDPSTGFVKDTHGVSVFDNPLSVSSRGLVPHQVDQSTIPSSLRIIQRGKDPHHFEIVPRPGANLTPQEFTNACNSILCVR